MKIEEIPEAFGSPLRLAIISSLVTQQLLFTELKETTGATDGNLSVQLKKLTQWGYIEAKKVLSNGKLATLYRLSGKGLEEFEGYVSMLEQVLKDSE